MREIARDAVDGLYREYVSRFFFGLRILTYERNLLVSELARVAPAAAAHRDPLVLVVRMDYDKKKASSWALRRVSKIVASAKPLVRIRTLLSESELSSPDKINAVVLDVAAAYDRWSLQVAMYDGAPLDRDSRSFFFEQINNLSSLEEVFSDPMGIGAKFLKDYFAELELVDLLSNDPGADDERATQDTVHHDQEDDHEEADDALEPAPEELAAAAQAKAKAKAAADAVADATSAAAAPRRKRA
ncbi:uncharacterized protein AMSG_10196 [Thecamonas trahens ATCC 50062]|uniref:Alfin N-terminal domain-containing protein n=1 Tax=Thecamonas trahens ATCC 50062 TaxID=461836 RepID=A0A0L0DTZ8_THETB|nr:hypothetical protein AMSG_10196 [Thecamonas trahens ATCC 50062]KNC54953.1 hypothetical protein AMSG_10196 [Thecamonas trahens ATCC 50062]|eukprot:XP_013753402.1 hypothetical protein AMSG_10196 [Thecamonas trahens ATCC 50062]